MGDYASKSKDSKFHSKSCTAREVPPPPAPKVVEPEAKPTTQEKTENECEQEKEKHVEEPLVDLFEPKNEAPILSTSAVPAAVEAAMAKLKEETEELAKEAAYDNSMKEDKKDMASLVQLM